MSWQLVETKRYIYKDVEGEVPNFEDFENNDELVKCNVTEEEKTMWNSKETTEGAQNKANEALNQAKKYTDKRISEIEFPINESDKPDKAPKPKRKENLFNDIDSNKFRGAVKGVNGSVFEAFQEYYEVQEWGVSNATKFNLSGNRNSEHVGTHDLESISNTEVGETYAFSIYVKQLRSEVGGNPQLLTLKIKGLDVKNDTLGIDNDFSGRVSITGVRNTDRLELQYFAPFKNWHVEVVAFGMKLENGKDVTQYGDILDGHEGDRQNPHHVTKKQVGLGNVKDYGIASIEEAIEGVHTEKYMTPSLVKRAINANGVNGGSYEEMSDSLKVLDSKLLITVGQNGDYNTLNSALSYASRFVPGYNKAGKTSEWNMENSMIEIKILSGFYMEEQIIVEGSLKLGHIAITAEDKTVPVKRSALTEYTTAETRPIFSGHHNVELPYINAHFTIDNQPKEGVHVDERTAGIQVVGNSTVSVGSEGGVNGAGRGLYVNGGSFAYTRFATFEHNGRGMRVSQSSQVSGRNMRMKYNKVGGYIAQACKVDLRESDLSYCGSPLSINQGSIVDFQDGIANNYENRGATVIYATLTAIGASFKQDKKSDKTIGIWVDGGTVDLSRAQVYNNNDREDIRTKESGIVHAWRCRTTNSVKTGNTWNPSIKDTSHVEFNVVDKYRGGIIYGRVEGMVNF